MFSSRRIIRRLCPVCNDIIKPDAEKVELKCHIFHYSCFITSALLEEKLDFRKCIICLEELKVKFYEFEDDIKMENHKDVCSICHEELGYDKDCKHLNCNHLFHTTCIERWEQVSDTCPLCRETNNDGVGVDRQLNFVSDSIISNLLDISISRYVPRQSSEPPPNIIDSLNILDEEIELFNNENYDAEAPERLMMSPEIPLIPRPHIPRESMSMTEASEVNLNNEELMVTGTSIINNETLELRSTTQIITDEEYEELVTDDEILFPEPSPQPENEN